MDTHHVEWVKVWWNKDFYERCKEVCPIRVYGECPSSIMDGFRYKYLNLDDGYEDFGNGTIRLESFEDSPFNINTIYSRVYMEIPKEYRDIFTDLVDYDIYAEIKPVWYNDEEDFWEEYKYQY